MPLKITKELTIGDVIEADDSWCIDGVGYPDGTAWKPPSWEGHRDEPPTRLTISQNFKFVAGQDDRNWGPECEVDYNGPKVGHLSYSGGPHLRDVVKRYGIDIADRDFLVVDVRQKGGGPDPYPGSIPHPNEPYVTACEVDNNYEIRQDGLRIEFYQSASRSPSVPQPKVIGRREPAFGPFKPV